MPKVSVIIPCYNHGEYLDSAVDSILAQTFQDFEIIVVDDGSTDEFTQEKLKNYNPPKTQVFLNQNKGVSAARNFGIARSKGEYILPLDADDYFVKTFLEKAVKILDEQSDVGMVKCYVKNFGAYNNYWMPNGRELADFLESSQSTVSVMFRKSIWQEISGYNEKIKTGFEDWDFNIRIIANGWKVACIEEPLFFYRRKIGSRLEECLSRKLECLEQVIVNNIDLYKENIVEVLLKKEKLILGMDTLNKIIDERFSYVEKIFDFIEDKGLKQELRTKITREQFKNLIENSRYKNVYFYGAGAQAEKLEKSYDFSLIGLKGFIDSNSLKKNEKIGEYKIFMPEDIEKLNPDLIAITARLNPEIIEFLYETRRIYNLNFKIASFFDLD